MNIQLTRGKNSAKSSMRSVRKLMNGKNLLNKVLRIIWNKNKLYINLVSKIFRTKLSVSKKWVQRGRKCKKRKISCFFRKLECVRNCSKKLVNRLINEKSKSLYRLSGKRKSWLNWFRSLFPRKWRRKSWVEMSLWGANNRSIINWAI